MKIWWLHKIRERWFLKADFFVFILLCRQLPNEARLFAQVDKSWKDIMRRTIDKPNALKASTAAGINARMNEIINFKFCGTSLLRRTGEVVEVSGFKSTVVGLRSWYFLRLSLFYIVSARIICLLYKWLLRGYLAMSRGQKDYSQLFHALPIGP